MQQLYYILSFALDAFWYVIIAHIVMSWLINFEVLNLRQPLVAQLWFGLNKLLQPIYVPIRRVLPPMAGLDLAPLVLIFGIFFLRQFLQASMSAFG
ncbi:YggT family protein [Abyssibius alkaniclasticus]|uniref:YggT family protein n=1 Tax=Abyssibius alkaniclasticus TaxID=2881234 RepID=UPI0023645A35|nr:YggT family protein [Abyssibius alkaniclasticus]UPH71425.1 YggT family protein [Abyssibius alkaniclasticus]|tara:strand:+ start:277 stop:564 length:288 start_codon:yes stop_codon:yes gene_type:complete